MSVIETVNDVNNPFLARREITCNFSGLAGKLKKLEAAEMITKEFKLDGKIVIPIIMKNHSGKPVATGTFYVYDDEKTAKKQVNPVIFERLEKAKKKGEKPAEAKEESTEKSEEKTEEKKEEVKAEEKPPKEEEKKE